MFRRPPPEIRRCQRTLPAPPDSASHAPSPGPLNLSRTRRQLQTAFSARFALVRARLPEQSSEPESRAPSNVTLLPEIVPIGANVAGYWRHPRARSLSRSAYANRDLERVLSNLTHTPMGKLTEQTNRRAVAELFLFGGGDQLIFGIWSLTCHSPLLDRSIRRLHRPRC
jgi:hypothetical protein